MPALTPQDWDVIFYVALTWAAGIPGVFLYLGVIRLVDWLGSR